MKLVDAMVIATIQQRGKLEKPPACPNEVYDIMYGCWRIDPQTRMTAINVLKEIEKLQPDADELTLTFPSRHGIAVAEDDEQAPKIECAPELIVGINSKVAQSAFKALEMPKSTVTLVDDLGSGAFGEVKLGKFSINPSSTDAIDVAVKTLKTTCNADSMERFLYEARILAYLNHPNLVRLLAVCTDTEPFYMVLEYLKDGDLLKYLNDLRDVEKMTGSMPELSELVEGMKQIADVMSYFERQKIIHRDLAARNILVARKDPMLLKLSDVGLARSLETSDYYRKSSDAKV